MSRFTDQIGRRSARYRALCLLGIVFILLLAFHVHANGRLEGALHCPSCAAVHSATPGTFAIVLPVAFHVTGSVATSDLPSPITQFAVHVYIRPPPSC